MEELQCDVSICGFDWLLILFRSKELQSESMELRERIKHLNDMVFCQQRKVKGMIEEVRSVFICLCANTINSHALRSSVLIVF